MSIQSEQLYKFCKVNGQSLHTPDERYTLPEIYDAVLDYATKRYHLEDKHIVRPFIPGGDYQQYAYGENDVVVDNPPFSITTKIVHWYIDHNVPFFLFINGQYGVSLSRSLVGKATVILTGVSLKYHTGSPVQGGFVTNLDNKSVIIKTAPELTNAFLTVQNKNKKKQNRYQFPYYVVKNDMICNLARKGFDYQLKTDEAKFINSLDGMRKINHDLYGGGYLVSKQAYNEYISKLNSYHDPKVKVIKLTDGEKEIVNNLTKKAGRRSEEISLF